MNRLVIKMKIWWGYLLLGIVACTSHPTITEAPLIPLPNLVKEGEGKFTLGDDTQILIQENNKELQRMGNYLVNLVRPSTGFELEIVPYDTTRKSGFISLELESDPKLGDEGYRLEIKPEFISLSANTPAGIFHGIQTIRQLLPNNIESKGWFWTSWEIPSGLIVDKPEYAYRGTMLDVARHFFEKEELKRYIDILALYKINFLHLHLTDDQGWRIEVKSWPKLTLIGGSTEVGGGVGGFYTQNEYKEIVQYALERYITIVPEIDMPGHTHAALASYPELNCDGKARENYTKTQVGFSSLCLTEEITYQFVDDVVREISAITPGPYIHIGGDEAHATELGDYILFIEQVQDAVNSYGKNMIGWDEVAQAALRPESLVQFWSNPENAKLGADQGVKIIMSPAWKTYLDMQYDSTTHLGLHWAGFIELDSAYLWEPSELIEGIGKDEIIGVEAPLWTETITNMDELEYMVFPRLLGIAEVGWTRNEKRNWGEYRKRLKKHLNRLEALEVDYYSSNLLKK
ncbi:beta-N-acetylhexosaminidase [Echinicola jeungdonensis]|uniref:beta-N-acetylhexosaminidase n=1 Tax=Echinicola jeungdonensis TaxID=709343 RepID=A0ABV5J497_9BACT|nr:beta-N-acetylhexosaminidase [Echinicola jeungdonensis]MDN3670046.1 beta-N-acetylhexosaminidase [Echinicola jeungdonensis]